MSVNFGKKIREIRTSKNITQVQLAEMAGIGLNTLCRYERNERVPKMETLTKIADALDINLTELFFDENVKEISITNFTTEGELFVLRNDTIQKYDSLNYDGQQKVNDYITDLLRIDIYKKAN